MSEIVFEPIDQSISENHGDAVRDTSPGLEAVRGDGDNRGDAAEVVPVNRMEAAAIPEKRKPGRPRGSVNKPKAAAPQPKEIVPVIEPKATPKRPVKMQSRRTQRQMQQVAEPRADDDDSSSSEEDATIYGTLMQDDMETQILRFLSARKQDQSQKRQNLWANLASSGLR